MTASHPAPAAPRRGGGRRGHAPADPPALAELLDRVARSGPPVVDADELVAVLESLGIDDRTARLRYAASSVFTLAETVLGRLGSTAAGPPAADPTDPPRLAGVLGTCWLGVTVALAAVAGHDQLGDLPWPVPAAALALAWGAAQALGRLGQHLAPRHGSGPAARAMAAGFLVLAGLWLAAGMVAPVQLRGPDRLPAALVGVTAVALAATVAAARLTGVSRALLAGGAPIWLLAAAAVSDGWHRLTPTGTPAAVLPPLVAVLVLIAYRPVLRSAGPVPRPDRRAVRGLLAHLGLGIAKAAAVVLVWRAGPAGLPPPGILPVLLAAPLIELLLGWHLRQATTGLDRYDTVAGYARHIRGLATVTVAALLPPLAVGAGLTAAAYRLPYGLTDHVAAGHLVLALAAGTLLAGLLGATSLLAAYGRPGRALLLAALPAAATAAAAVVAVPPVPGTGAGSLTGTTTATLPVTVAALAVALLVGLVTVALAAFDHRSRR